MLLWNVCVGFMVSVVQPWQLSYIFMHPTKSYTYRSFVVIVFFCGRETLSSLTGPLVETAIPSSPGATSFRRNRLVHSRTPTALKDG